MGVVDIMPGIEQLSVSASVESVRCSDPPARWLGVEHNAGTCSPMAAEERNSTKPKDS